MSSADKIKQIAHDLRHGGWYFRIWLAVWIVGFIMTFTAAIIFIGKRSESGAEKDWVLWVQNTSSFQFPEFWIKTLLPGETLLTVQCVYQGQEVPSGVCHEYDALHCKNILGNRITAERQGRNFNPGSLPAIRCEVTTSVFGNATADSALDISIARSWGGDTIWVTPNENAWVDLGIIVMKPLGGRNTDGFTTYSKRLAYHGQVAVNGHYIVHFLAADFFALHYDQTDSYDGWMTTADIGGFAFFMVVIHAVVLFAASVFLDDHSTFLKPTEST